MKRTDAINEITRGFIKRLAPFGWQVDWIGGQYCTYFFALEVKVAGHPRCGQVLKKTIALSDEWFLLHRDEGRLRYAIRVMANDLMRDTMEELDQ